MCTDVTPQVVEGVTEKGGVTSIIAIALLHVRRTQWPMRTRALGLYLFTDYCIMIARPLRGGLPLHIFPVLVLVTTAHMTSKKGVVVRELFSIPETLCIPDYGLSLWALVHEDRAFPSFTTARNKKNCQRGATILKL